MNRLTRDEILHRGLDMVDAPSLDAKDRPSGAIEPGALCLSWLQEALDQFHNEFPWQGAIRKVPVTLDPAGAVTFTDTSVTPAVIRPLPRDFILDVRDGLVIQGFRIRRKGLQDLIDRQVISAQAGLPMYYAWAGGQLVLWPLPKSGGPATLWYYALPPLLTPADVPHFPTDWLLVEYIHLKGREWLRQAQYGTARVFANDEIARLRKAGLAGEPEGSRIPFDETTWMPGEGDPNAWMGSTIVQP